MRIQRNKYNKQNIYRIKYNLLMKKLSETYFKQVQTKPIRMQSPDRKSSNSIQPTQSPQNIEYILKQPSLQSRTPTKSYQTPNKDQHQTISNSRYFIGNKSSQIKKSTFIKTQEEEYYPTHHLNPTNRTNPSSNNRSYTHQSHIQSHCQNCVGHCRCVHAAANEEVVVELKKIITMINGNSVSTFHAGQNQELVKSLEILKGQNQRLVELLDKYKARVQSRIQPVPNNYQSQVRILREQLNHNIGQHQKQREQLYRTNKALTSQLKSLESKLSTTQIQLKHLQSQSQSQVSLNKQQQYSQISKQKKSDKLSLSMIKQQYNESLKTFQNNIQFQIDNKMNDYQTEMKQYQLKIRILEDKLKGFEKLDYLNKSFNQENKRLKKWIQDRDREATQERSQRDEQMDRLMKENYDLEEQNRALRGNGEKGVYQVVISELREGKRALQKKVEQTDKKVKQLMQNYEKEIKILKSKHLKDEGSASEKLRVENEEYWQQILKLRNQLVKYTTQNSKLELEVKNHQEVISQLNHQINNQHINLLAKTTLLQNQNHRLTQELKNNPNAQSQSRLHALTQHNQALQADYKALQADYNSLQASYSALQNDNKGLNRQITNLTMQYNGFNDQITALNHENTRLRDQNHEVREQLRISGSRVDELSNGKQKERLELIRQLDIVRMERDGLAIQMDKVRSEHTKRQLQLRQNMKSQLDETKRLYEQQLSQAESQYKSLQSRQSNLTKQHQFLQQQYKTTKTSQDQSTQLLLSKQHQILQHEQTISNLSKILQETQQKILKLQENRQDRDKQIYRLSQELNKLKIKYQNGLKDNNQYWQQEVNSLIGQINYLNTQVKNYQFRWQDEQRKVGEMRGRVGRLRSDGLKRELEELKRLVDDGLFGRIEDELLRISENLQKQLIRSEQKSLQIDKLSTTKCQLQSRISQLQHIQLTLTQKLQKSQTEIHLYQQQQKSQKQFCNSLLAQKLNLQKQNITLKRSRLDKQSIEATKLKARLISQKIDQLLALDQQRVKDYQEISEFYGAEIVGKARNV